MQRRALWIAIIFTAIMLVYVGRLVMLQLDTSLEVFQPFGTRSKSTNWRLAAVNQRRSQLVLDDGRGQFLDDHGRPITGERYDTIVFSPASSWKSLSDAKLKQLAEAMDQPIDQLKSYLLELKHAAFYLNSNNLPIRLSRNQLVRIEEMHIEGLAIASYRNRYSTEQRHVIGYVAENPEWIEKAYAYEIAHEKGWSLSSKVGVIGLEYSLDRYLHGVGASYISFTLDAKAKPITGIGTTINAPNNPYYPLQVVTTLDINLQQKIEEYVDNQQLIQGAVVLLDITNGDIKTMVSRPQLLPGKLQQGQEEVLRNHALTAFSPGSVYKIVTAAAAIEYGVLKEDEIFHCDGHYGKYGLSCWKPEGHGEQTLKEAFANSCNVVFATLSERLTPEQMNNTASALGLLHKVGWHTDIAKSPLHSTIRLLAEEEEGRVFSDRLLIDGGVMAQTGIGQRDVRLTPLQAANMMVTLWHGGIQYENRVVSKIVYNDGQLLSELPVHRSHENRFSIHPHTAAALMEYTQEVVNSGTGKSISHGKWEVAGKSGTAELAGSLEGMNHQWFVGYAPVHKPKYALAVLVEQQPAGTRNKATKMFRDIMDIVASENKS